MVLGEMAAVAMDCCMSSLPDGYSYRGLRPQMHSAHEKNPAASEYSDAAWGDWLTRAEWFRVQLMIDFSGEGELHDSPAPDANSPVMFHGTEWGSAIQIVRQRAFITGPGTHSIRGKSRSGCWCVPTLPDALQRAQPTRYSVAGDFSRWCCPVVLELRAAKLIRVPGRTMHCSPGPVGQSNTGLVIDAIHFNIRLMENFLELEKPQVRALLAANPYHNRICACGLCGELSSA